jgi:hypothetical protein
MKVAAAAPGAGVIRLRTFFLSAVAQLVTLIGVTVTVLACVEAYGVTLGGRSPGARGYLGAPLPPLWDALLDLGLGCVIGAAGLWLRATALRARAPVPLGGKSP